MITAEASRGSDDFYSPFFAPSSSSLHVQIKRQNTLKTEGGWKWTKEPRSDYSCQTCRKKKSREQLVK